MFPKIRRSNGHVIDERRPSVEVPGLTVVGARVLTPGERLMRAGRITAAQGEAAREWYGLVQEAESGRSPRWIGDRSGRGGDGDLLTERQARALEKLPRAEDALGPMGRRFLTDVLVYETAPVAAFLAYLSRTGQEAVTRSVADQRAVGHLQALLEILVHRWRIVPRYGRPAPRLP